MCFPIRKAALHPVGCRAAYQRMLLYTLLYIYDTDGTSDAWHRTSLYGLPAPIHVHLCQTASKGPCLCRLNHHLQQAT